MMKKASIVLTLTVLLLLSGLVTSACNGSLDETTPTAVEKLELEPTQVAPSSLESSSSPEPTDEPAPNPTEPIVDPSLTTPESTSVDTGLDGKTLLIERCSECHDLTRVTSKSKPYEGWKTIVERMIDHGADLNADEQEVLIQYLAETYP